MWNGTETQIKIMMLRHGRTAANERGEYLGKRDEPLSEKGAEEIRRAVGKYPPDQVDLVVCSPLSRCLETARILWPQATVWVEEGFAEMDFGLWEGKTYQELLADPATGETYQDWIDGGGTAPFPEGESREVFIERVLEGWRHLSGLIPGMAGEVAFVVHGGTIMALLSFLFGGDYFDYQVSPGEGYEFLWNPDTGGVSALRKKTLMRE